MVDLALAHLKAIDYTGKTTGIDYFNVGTGNGYSVLEMVKAFGDVWGTPVKYKIAPRRPGDIATCFADPAKARRDLNWSTEKTLEDMCKDSWNFIEKNR